MTANGPRYYLAVFSWQSWREFRDHGGTVYGTTKNKINSARKIEKDDLLICYLSKWAVFVGVLRVIQPARYDETPLYGQGVFPVRLDVEMVNALDPENGVPVLDLQDQLTIFKRLKNPNHWSGFFVNAFSRFPEEDGMAIVKMFEEWKGCTAPRRIRTERQKAVENCREKIHAAVLAVIAEKGRNEFTIPEVQKYFHTHMIKGCSGITITIYITNTYCAGESLDHAKKDGDYERIGRGLYRLRNWET